MWGNNTGKSEGLFPSWMRTTVGPLLLILSTVPAALLMVHLSSAEMGGSVFTLWDALKSNPFGTIKNAFITPDERVVKVFLAFCAWQLFLMKYLPGKEFKGTVTATGHIPVYKANGLQAYFLTIFSFVGFSTDIGIGSKLPEFLQYKANIFFEIYPQFISFMNIFALLFCLFLYIKGHVAPTSTDYGSNDGQVVFDYYWGMELYPRIFGWDVKMFTNCRFGMMLWAVLPISFAAHLSGQGNFTNAMWANVVIQLIYVAKFFWWETGYLASMDIQHDRAGFYICWGCLVWVPSLYVCHSWYIAAGTAAGRIVADISTETAYLYVAIGFLMILINYDCDRQRAYVRNNYPNCTVWGRKPDVIKATYTTGKGDEKRSILLYSGWWGVASHFHYVPEILAAFMWTIPAGFDSIVPFFYVMFLTILLLDRSFRDDARCQDKYGKYWDQYRALVPYKLIPGII